VTSAKISGCSFHHLTHCGSDNMLSFRHAAVSDNLNGLGRRLTTVIAFLRAGRAIHRQIPPEGAARAAGGPTAPYPALRGRDTVMLASCRKRTCALGPWAARAASTASCGHP
jgi:hypothetical protein